MLDEGMELLDQEETEVRSQLKRRKRQAFAYIEEENHFKEDIEDER